VLRPGPELVEHVEDKIGARFNAIHPNISLAIDQPLAADLGGILRRAAVRIPNEAAQLRGLITDQISRKIAANNGRAPGDVVQSITSELGNEIKGYSTDTSFDKRKLSGFIADVRQAVSDAIERQNPQYAQPLKDANKAWALYAKLRDAAGRQGGDLGKFSPAQLMSAAKKGERASTKAGIQTAARNPMLDLGAAAQKTLRNSVPDSGTPERGAMLHALGAFGHGAAPFVAPQALIPGAAIAALYNPVGQSLARAAILSRPAGAETLRNILQTYAPQTAARLPILAGSGAPSS